MSHQSKLRIAGIHAECLFKHLFPGDGKEAVAFALCGRHASAESEVLLVQELHCITYDDCPIREDQRVTWKTESLESILVRASQQGLGIVKFHSHPTGYAEFSDTDDKSDRDLFPSIYGWVDDEGPHASVVVLPDGSMFGRIIDINNKFWPLNQILIAGDDVEVYRALTGESVPDFALRHAQLFGDRTTCIMGQLSVGVVGCSGTGGFVIQMLARLGVKKLVLIDPDRVEHKNLNRIIGTSRCDADEGRLKVDALAGEVSRIGLGTEVKAVATTLASRQAVLALAECDIVFGCMDSHDGRRTLNRLSNFYLLPYFDCGVGLVSDGKGGIDEVVAGSHYIQPGRSTLAGRRVINNKRATDEALARGNPEQFKKLHAEKYVEGVSIESPAVISVNCLASAMVVNEFLARIHPFRSDRNDRYASVRFSFSGMYLSSDEEMDESPLPRSLGRGDVEPLLDQCELSQNG